jgi:hypothetical protein
MRVQEFNEVKESGIPCVACQAGRCYPVFKPRALSIGMVGDAWSDKNLKEKEYRAQRSSYLGKKQRDSHFVPTLQPNYNGEETGTWRDAMEVASKDDKDITGYVPLVAKEGDASS